MSQESFRVALTVGDPRGIGPEVMLRAADVFREERPDVGLLFLAPRDIDTGRHPREVLPPTDGSEASSGAASVRALERAVDLALDGEVAAVVTGPVAKPALRAAGRNVPGQTELLRDLTGASAVGMLMAAERTRAGAPLRVLLATTHLPLRRVPDVLTADLLVEQALLLAAALREGWDLADPRLGVCALNPHASDGGLFGDEEARVLEPAVARIRAAGVRVEGPVPADTVFVRALGREFDAVVAPYHDVGMAAFKTVAFGTGVNVTLGLPFPRTSPDHGTAFHLAGTGRADAESALEALRLAARLAGRRFDSPARAV